MGTVSRSVVARDGVQSGREEQADTQEFRALNP